MRTKKILVYSLISSALAGFIFGLCNIISLSADSFWIKSLIYVAALGTVFSMDWQLFATEASTIPDGKAGNVLRVLFVFFGNLLGSKAIAFFIKADKKDPINRAVYDAYLKVNYSRLKSGA